MTLNPILRSLAVAGIAAITVFNAGCGGGGGSGDGAGDPVQGGDVVVLVVDARNAAAKLEGASVTVQAGSTSKSATTAADGVATIRGLPAGSATVTVARDLFREFTVTGRVDPSQPVGLTAPLQRRTGQVDVKAVDGFDTPVANVQVQVSVEGQVITGVTGTTGQTSLVGVPTGLVDVQASASGFQAEPAQPATVAESPHASVEFALDRKTEAGGGTLPPRPNGPSLPPTDGQTLTFRVRTVVIDAQGRAIENLQAADFSLVACADSRAGVADCVRSPTEPAFDAAYTPTSPTPVDFVAVPGQSQPAPFAVTLGYDQSGSIANTDPTDARVFASKGFLQKVGSTDRVAVSAFAAGASAKIPDKPVTRLGGFSSNGAEFFDEIGLLPTLEGGDTPLFDALNAMMQDTAVSAPAGLRKAVVLFSDGMDTECKTDAAACRDHSIALSRTLGVDIFTIGLANSVDTATLSELAYRANGAFLVADNAEQLNALYGALGPLLRGTMTTYETTWTIRAANAGVFASGRTVLGAVKVVTTDRTLDLPFVYRIP